jgi:hypothetical protein
MSDASTDDHELGDDDELALLGVLATGLEFRQQQTNGLHIGETAGRRTHEDLLELQRGAGGPED